ncbi:hypothetical protein HYPSUDRAFT_1105134 [Hypholoma sublateritium FD-334 SS-4]|uniref:Epoxide hydrolase N-terminal domain-containing protein n=1 Tax=Hypholoma sublateritium (strain FD-334 SS-4) TaxID=945553 RepID=A0A0D2KQQ3_HYPSF|nr:hypothetical protein HYPSUDRAFT_1105134 [Hypholoma sublateritium FD-334 SS-4]
MESPFKICIPDSVLEQLQQKLATTVLPDELDDAGWDYGAPLPDIKRLVARWREGYDWRKQEALLNSGMPQFTRDIHVDGFGSLNIHYVHQRSGVEGAIPLLFVHGWPGSFLEVQKILPLLVEGSSEYPAFHVVAFSLPGYAFSEGPKKKGFSPKQCAEVGNTLMIALGYPQYVTQGGDWGAVITRFGAHRYGPQYIKAWHTNLPMTPAPSLKRTPWTFLSTTMERTAWYDKKSSGYFKEQSTMPQTLGYSLADSPVGLLAWIYEKLVIWAGEDYHWDDDEVLTWVSVYWFSRAGPAASVRIYYEAAQEGNIFTDLPSITIPTGYSYFPNEIVRFPRRWLKAPTLVFESEHKSGGHFASTEKPMELVADLRRMFGKGGPAFGVVPGKTGYAKEIKAKL